MEVESDVAENRLQENQRIIWVLSIDDDLHHYQFIHAQLALLAGDVHLDRLCWADDHGRALKEREVHCILTDDQAPNNMDLDLLKALRKEGCLIPFILLSDLEGIDEQGFQVGQLSDDKFNVVINHGRFDLLNYWIHRLFDLHSQHLESDRVEAILAPGTQGDLENLTRAWNELTKREIEILSQIAEGKSNKEIAFDLGISERTVTNHIYSAFGKLRIHCRAEAVRIAIGMKLRGGHGGRP